MECYVTSIKAENKNQCVEGSDVLILDLINKLSSIREKDGVILSFTAEIKYVYKPSTETETFEIETIDDEDSGQNRIRN